MRKPLHLSLGGIRVTHTAAFLFHLLILVLLKKYYLSKCTALLPFRIR